MRLNAVSGLHLWQSPLLDSVPGVWHCFTSRIGGVSTGHHASLNLSMRVDDDEASVLTNRVRLAEVAGLPPHTIVLQTQVHEADVVELTDACYSSPVAADAFIASSPGLPAIVGVADCAPVLLAVEGGPVAAVHAGWRGAVSGVVGAAVAALADRGGAGADRLVAAVGPCIGSCCFEVDPEVAARFPAKHVAMSGAKHRVDLGGSVVADLVAAGVPPDRIDYADVCTACNDACFSHRASAGRTGRMVGLIVQHN